MRDFIVYKLGDTLWDMLRDKLGDWLGNILGHILGDIHYYKHWLQCAILILNKLIDFEFDLH